MNKIQKVVGASIIGALTLAPVGSAFATMTAANVENFYNMPFTLTRINYKYNYIGMIFRKKVKMANIVVINPAYTEEYADEHYETMGVGEVEWGDTVFSGDLSSFPANAERFVVMPDGLILNNEFSLIYYAIEFMDGGHYEGKISYAPCSKAFREEGYSSRDYECRIHYYDGRASLSEGVNGGTYMSSYTAARYTGGNEVPITYEYGLVLESVPLLNLPADIKSREQKGMELEQGGGTDEELLWQWEESRREIDYLQNELDAMNEINVELENLKNELAATVESQSAEIERLQNELAAGADSQRVEIERLQNELAVAMESGEAEISRLQDELANKDALHEEELSNLRAELATQLAESQAKVEYWQGLLNEKVEEIANLQAEMSAKELASAQKTENLEAEIAELKDAIVEKEAGLAAETEKWRAELAEKEAAWEVQIEQKKAELAEKEATRLTETDALKDQLSELEKVKTAELAVLREELAALEVAKLTDTETLIQKLSEVEMARVEERKTWELKIAELEQKANAEPIVQTKTVYVDREVIKEVEKDCEVAVTSEEEVTTEKGEDTESEVVGAIETTPELSKEADKQWWTLLPIGAAVCALAYWWLAPSEPKLKKKK